MAALALLALGVGALGALATLPVAALLSALLWAFVAAIRLVGRIAQGMGWV